MTVEVIQLRKRYGARTVLDIPSLRLDRGELVGLVGSNGAGKTTLLRLMLDLIPATHGAVRLGDQEVSTGIEWKRHTGAFLDRSFLIDFLTVDEYFHFIGSLYGLTTHDIRLALAPYQAFYPDEEFGHTTRYLRDLSTGNAKKIGIIAAMFIRPRLLLLDEPFANLDPPSQIRLKRLLLELNVAHATTMLISSHDLVHVTDLCRRITVLEQGRLARDLSTSQATLKELEQYFTA